MNLEEFVRMVLEKVSNGESLDELYDEVMEELRMQFNYGDVP